MRQATKRICAMNMPTPLSPKLKSVPEWFEEKMLRNDTKFQAQTERANFCSFPIENVKGAQNETNSKVKLSKNMWRQISNWHIPNSWAPGQLDAEEIDDEAMTGQKDTGTWSQSQPMTQPKTKSWENKWRAKHKTLKSKEHNKSTIWWGKMLTRLSKNTKSLKVHASSTILGNQLICNIFGSTFLQSLA